MASICASSAVCSRAVPRSMCFHSNVYRLYIYCLFITKCTIVHFGDDLLWKRRLVNRNVNSFDNRYVYFHRSVVGLWRGYFIPNRCRRKIDSFSSLKLFLLFVSSIFFFFIFFSSVNINAWMDVFLGICWKNARIFQAKFLRFFWNNEII